MRRIKKKLPEIAIGMVGHIAHGKTTLTRALTGKLTLAHSEELKRGITIRLGYANFVIRKCPKCGEYTTQEKCPKCGEKAEPVKRVYIIDAPGHETLMATMIAAASIIDAAVLVIAANEPCPQPQTKEHLKALEIAGIKHIVVVQNKIDTVSKEKAIENYKQIKEFVKGTIAENAPIIPISAQHGKNLDILLKILNEEIPVPNKDLTKDPIFLIARSFDVNKPGTPIEELRGGVIGGALIQGTLKVGDEIEILPGRRVEENGQVKYIPIKTKIESLSTGTEFVDEIYPGESAGVGTKLDPMVTKSDQLAGNVAGKNLPPVWTHLKVEVHLLDKIVGFKEEMDVEPIKTNEPLMINAWTAKSLGIVTKIKGNEIEMNLRIPICIAKGEKIILSRRIGQKWRLIGYGIIK